MPHDNWNTMYWIDKSNVQVQKCVIIEVARRELSVFLIDKFRACKN